MDNQAEIMEVANNNFCLKVCIVLLAKYCKNETEINDFKKGMKYGLDNEMAQSIKGLNMDDASTKYIVDMFDGVKCATDTIFKGVIAAKRQMGD